MISILKGLLSGSETLKQSTLSPASCLERYEPGATMIDVRTAGEFQRGHLACAIHVDATAPDFRARIAALNLDSSKPVYLYCRSGNRSGHAARTMREIGYMEAFNVGGYNALKSAGFETE